jgi:HSP20 family protein
MIFRKETLIMNGLNLYGDIFAELGRLQQEVERAFQPGGASSIRALPRGAFPVINVGTTPDAIEVLALAPGLDPAALQLTVDKGLLVVAGERKEERPAGDKVTVYARERFQGAFRRVIPLPEDADPARISAHYRDGLLRVSVARRESSKPRQIQIH